MTVNVPIDQSWDDRPVCRIDPSGTRGGRHPWWADLGNGVADDQDVRSDLAAPSQIDDLTAANDAGFGRSHSAAPVLRGPQAVDRHRFVLQLRQLHHWYDLPILDRAADFIVEVSIAEPDGF
jgi:hypothetical protein